MRITAIILLLFTTIVLCNCKSAQNENSPISLKLEEKPSFQLGQVYFQKWIAGVQGGGSGIHFYMMIETNLNHVVFDSVYFKGQKAKLKIGKTGYLASFTTRLNQKENMVMDGDSKQEYGNELPQNYKSFPFQLHDNECVIQYTEKGITKFYKVEKVVEKQTEYYPSAPNNKQKQ